MARLLRRLLYLVRRDRLESELAEEMAFHRAMAERDAAASGASADAARLEARRTFGSSALAGDRARDVWIPPAFQGVVQDVRVAARMLWKTRIVSAVAVLSLALGIGANTAIFSLVNSVILRQLPARDPGQLALLANPGQFAGVPYYIGYPVWDQLRRSSDLFAGAAVWSPATFNLAAGGQTQLADTLVASGSFFDTLGVPPIAGRTFSDRDDASVPGHGDAEPVAVISYGLWQRRFGGELGTIGRSIALDGVSFTIVGVTPHDFLGPEIGRTFDVIVPLGTEPLLRPNDSWLAAGKLGDPFRLVVRLGPTRDTQGATAAIRSIQPAIRAATMPASWPARYRDQYLNTPFTLVPLADANWPVRHKFERPLLTMLAIVMLVLLVACGNIASLLLARARARRAELSVRRALGASRWRLVRQLLAESVLLAGTGGVLGLALSAAASRLLVGQISTQAYPIVLDLSVDHRVVFFTLAVTVATVLIFGMAPAVRYSRDARPDGFNADGHESRREARDRFSTGLVIAQVALSLALVVAAGLLGRTFASLAGRELGFDPRRIVLASISTQHTNIAPREREAVYGRIQEAVRALPDVAGASISFQAPIVTTAMLMQPIESVSGGPPLAGPRNALAELNIISTGWFDAVGIPLVEGRDFTERDGASAPPVAVVNQAFARRFLNGGDPMGHTIRLALPGAPRPPVEIVGVAADAIYGTLRSPISPTIYLPIPQLGALGAPFLATAYLTIRAAHGAPATLYKSVGDAINDVSPAVGVTFHTVDDLIGESLSQERVLAMVSATVGLLSLLLAALGLYGVVAYAAARRQREFGIRMALGATPRDVRRLVLGRVVVLVGAGIALGTGASAWASRLISALLYDVRPRDAATLAGAASVLAAVTLVAAWVPARRASRIDPAVTLRCE